ncbi:MAG: hypothetical protein QXI32_04840 [Candidatus Bathyarchaeia archaeon]
MSVAKDEPTLIKEFRELYNYVILVGRHINEIHNRLGKIEESIKEIKANHSSFVKESSAEISNIIENMVTKSEFNDLVERMERSMAEMLPPLPTLIREEPHITGGQQEAIGQ